MPEHPKGAKALAASRFSGVSHIALALTVALLAAACHTPAPVTRPHVASGLGLSAGIIGDAGASIIGDAGASIISNNGGSLVGTAKIPAGIVSNNSSSLISDQGGAIISNNGGGVISDQGGGLTSKTKYALQATSEAPLSGFVVTLVDAGGTPFKDANGHLFQATTDATGAYSFARTPRGANLVLRLELPAAVGPMFAFVPDAAVAQKRQVDVNGTSTLVMGYVLDQYVRTQPSPRQVLAKLPGNVEADTRAKAIAALGDHYPATRFTSEVIAATISGLRVKDTTFDAQMNFVRSLLVAGLKDDGDGQAATNVSLTAPCGVAALSDGSLLIAERNGHRVRRRWPDGHLTTYAGKDSTRGAGDVGDNGPAGDAFLDRPTVVVADAADNVFVTDSGTQRIRRIDAKTGLISTVAGNGQPYADFKGATALDGMDAVSAPLNHPVVLALDAANRPIFGGNNGYYRIEASGKLKALAADERNAPETLATGPDGTVYGYQHDNGTVSTLINDHFVPLASITGHDDSPDPWLTVAANGDLYIADYKKISHWDGKVWSQIPLTMPRENFKGLHVDAQGIVVCDSFKNRVWRVGLAGGEATQIAGLAPQSGDTPVPADSLGLNRPTFLALDHAGNLYIADGLNSVVWKRRPDGLYVRFAGKPDAPIGTPSGEGGPAAQAIIGKLIGITAKADGTILFVDGAITSGIHVREVGSDGKLKTKPLPLGVLFPAVLGLDARGALLIGDPLVREVFKLNGNQAEALAPVGALQQPSGIASAPDGSVYVADTKSAAIFRLADGAITTVVGGNGDGFTGDGAAAKSAKLSFPLGLAFDSQGRLYVADSHNDRVRRIDLKSGIITTVAGTGSSTLAGPTPDDSIQEPVGLAFDAVQNLYVADSGHNQVKLINHEALGL